MVQRMLLSKWNQLSHGKIQAAEYVKFNYAVYQWAMDPMIFYKIRKALVYATKIRLLYQLVYTARHIPQVADMTVFLWSIHVIIMMILRSL